MLKDFDMIVHKLPKELSHMNIYGLADLHIGSGEFNEKRWKSWKEMVLNDEYGFVVLVGDLLDSGLKTSKTNTYEQTMRPFEQKQWLKRELADFAKKGKILACISGNHEQRAVELADDVPLYDVMAKLDLEDVYRHNMAFVKLSLGYKNAERQWSYNLVLGHGASKGRVEKFSYGIDGMDVMVTGHTHQPSANFYSKLVIDPQNSTVSMRDFAHVVLPSFTELGGYALRAMYNPQSHTKYPVIRLDGTKKSVEIIWRD
jgi:predicted phosphodiesterase